MSVAQVSMTQEELQRALNILIRGSSLSGKTPIRSLAPSAVRYLSVNGFTVRRASYVLRCLSEGGVIERVDGRWAYQLLRATLERDDDSLSLPDQIAQQKQDLGDAQVADAGAIPAESRQEFERLREECEGLLEENEGLTGKLEAADLENQRLMRVISQKSLELQSVQGKAASLQIKVDAFEPQRLEYAKTLESARDLLERFDKLTSDHGTLQYSHRKLGKDNESLKKKLDKAEQDARTTAQSNQGLRGQVQRLERELRAHEACLSEAAVADVRRIADQLQAALLSSDGVVRLIRA